MRGYKTLEYQRNRS